MNMATSTVPSSAPHIGIIARRQPRAGHGPGMGRVHAVRLGLVARDQARGSVAHRNCPRVALGSGLICRRHLALPYAGEACRSAEGQTCFPAQAMENARPLPDPGRLRPGRFGPVSWDSFSAGGFRRNHRHVPGRLHRRDKRLKVDQRRAHRARDPSFLRVELRRDMARSDWLCWSWG